MKTKILILLAINLAMFMNVNAQCGSTCNQTFQGAPSGTFTSKFLCNSGDLIITTGSSLTLIDCELTMTPNAKITVQNGATLNILGSHIFSCTEMWQGIDVEQGGIVNVLSNNAICSLIEDAFVGVNFSYFDYGIQNTYVGIPFLTVDNAVFNRNEIGIQINGFGQGDIYTNLPNNPTYFSIGNCVFTCRHLVTNDFHISLPFLKYSAVSDVTTYPNTPNTYSQPYIEDINFPDNDAASFLKTPYTAYTMKSKAGIKLNHIYFGDDGVVIGNPNGIQGNNKTTIFDNTDIGIYAAESQFTTYNCTFQKPNSNFTTLPYYNTSAMGIAVYNPYVAYQQTGEHFVKIKTPNANCPNNAFFDLQFGIYGNVGGGMLISKCDIRSSQNINTQNTLQTGYNGFMGIYLSTDRYTNIDIINNEIYNVEYGVWVFNDYGSVSISDYNKINVSNNTIAHSLNPTFLPPLFNSQFVRQAVILYGFQPATGSPNNALINCQNNKIYQAFNGIEASFWKGVNTHIDYNVVTLAEDPNAYTGDEYYGIRLVAGEAAPSIDPITGLPYTDPNYYGNTVINNFVTGSCDDCKQIDIDANAQMGTHYGCNSVKNAVHGFRFTGGDNLNTRFWNNDIEKTNQYGYTLHNGGIIDHQGTQNGCTSDNIWAEDVNAWLAVNPSIPHYKTFADNSDALSSILVVQNDPNLNPNDNGLGSVNPTTLQVYDPYTVANGSLIISTSGSANCGRCNGDGKIQALARSSNLMEQIANGTIKVPADDAAKRKYVMQQQLYQLLTANPELVAQSTDLQNFINTNQWTGFDFINYTGYFLGKGDVATANLLLSFWTPSNKELDNNYYIFYDWMATMKTTPTWKPALADVFALANKCPLKSGNIVFAARNLYNKMTKKINKFTGDCNVAAPQSRGISADKQITKTAIYPNPNNGSFKIIFENTDIKQVKVFDIYGKVLLEKKYSSNETEAILNLKVARGLYFVHTQNSNNGKSTIEKIIVQ